MDVKKLVLLVGALVVAVMTALMARSMFGTEAAPPQAIAAAPSPTGPEVLVATRPLPIGTILGPDSVRYQPWPKELIGDAYYIRGQGADVAKLIGTVVRTELTAGQPLTQGTLVRPGDRGFLAAALGPGMRAVSVPVSANTGVAGFVFPGDRIDLMLTQEVAGGGDGAPLKVSETMIRNLRVLATDQRVDKEVDAEGKSTGRTFSTVTVEATPKIAEKIAVAQTMGTLSLSLRSLADSAADLERAIAAGEVDVPADGDRKAEQRMLLAIAAMPQDTDTTYTVGSDVSRFQRSTVPAKATMPTGMVGAPAAPAAGPATDRTVAGVRVARGNNVAQAATGSN